METSSEWLGRLLSLAPSMATVALAVIVLFAARTLLERRRQAGKGRQFEHQVIMLTLSVVAVLALVVTLPLGDATRGQLLAVFGILLSAAIAL